MSPERWQQIEAVFQSAVDLPASERDAFLTDACKTDDELLSQVRQLLSDLESSNNFIESPVWTDSGFLNSSAKKLLSESLEADIHNTKPDDFIGRQIGVYRLVSEIGRGGMGAVFLAERADGEFTQKVAIKLIKRGMDSDFIVRRFRHERQIMASFEHPYIARLLDGGSTKEGIPYFVMEYIEGQNLYEYCDRRRLDTRARLKIFQKVCSAIQYAHERQIIHRDIKPSNILINKYGNPKLLDFGIAKVLDPELIHESVNPTASIMRMMTPDYASPEQAQGTEITAASDIYSLGVLLYEFLTGHRPYNFTGRALHEVTRVICEVMPEQPSAILTADANLLPQYTKGTANFAEVRDTDIAGLERILHGDLENIVMKAMSKEKAHRYESAKAFSEDVSRFMNGEPVSAVPFVSNAADPPYKHLSPSTRSKALAILPFRYISLTETGDTDDRFLGLGLADALISRLSKVRRFVVRPTSSILSIGDTADPIKAGHDLRVDYILDGNIKKANNRLRVTVQLLNVKQNAAVWATSIDELVADVFSLEDTLSNKLIEVLLPQLTGTELEEYSKRGTEVPEAFEHYVRGRYFFNTFTEEGLAKAFVSFHRAIAADPNYAHAYSGIADYYNWLGIMGVLAPDECFRPGIEAATRAVELDSQLSEAHASLGFALHAGSHDWSRAEQHLRRAIELNPGNANAYVWYSIVLYTEGRFTDGLEFARRSVDLDPLTPFNHHNVGWGLYYARRFDEAAAQYRKVVTEYPEYGLGHYGLGTVYRMTGNTTEAVEENEKARKMMDDSMLTMFALAQSLAADSRRDEALQIVEDLDTMSASRFVSPYQMALAHSFLKDKERAFVYLEKAAETGEPWLNWLAIEPGFDFLRDDPRFEAISARFIYPGSFEGSLTGSTTFGSGQDRDTRVEENPQLHNLTTLVIEDGHKTDEGIAVTASPDHRPFQRKVMTTAFFVLAFIVGAVAVYHFGIEQYLEKNSSSVPVNLQNASIVILPFSSSDPAKGDIGTGFSDALSNKLGNIKSLQVISANSGRGFAKAEPASIGRELGVSFVLSGEIEGPADNLVVHAELINVRDKKAVWTDDLSVPDGDIFNVQKRLAEKIWTSLGIEPLPLEMQQVYKSYTSSSQAYQFYLIGRFQMTGRSADSLRKAIETFSTSIRFDPGFALPYVGLADAYSLLNLYDIEPPADAYEKAAENARKALAIDDDLAEAHASLAYIKYFHERDRNGAELEFRRAIQLNPSYAQAHHWFALALAGMGRPVEAVTEAQIAQRLDPRSPSIKSATAIVFFMNGQNADALAECDKALALDQGFVPALKVQRWTYMTSGDRDRAMDAFHKEMSFSGGQESDAGWKIIQLQLVDPTVDHMGEIAALEAAVQTAPVKNNDYAFAYEIALAFNNLGEREKALEWLERAYAASSHGIAFLSVDPRINNLRDDPRYRKIERKINRGSEATAHARRQREIV